MSNERRDVVKIMITDLDKVDFGSKDMLMCLLKGRVVKYFVELTGKLNYNNNSSYYLSKIGGNHNQTKDI